MSDNTQNISGLWAGHSVVIMLKAPSSTQYDLSKQKYCTPVLCHAKNHVTTPHYQRGVVVVLNRGCSFKQNKYFRIIVSSWYEIQYIHILDDYFLIYMFGLQNVREWTQSQRHPHVSCFVHYPKIFSFIS